MTAKIDSSDNVYNFELSAIDGDNLTLEEFKGDVLLIVNTASKCGFTPQYKELQALHDEYSAQGFKVLGFPSGNFGGQELDSNDEILEFCEMNYGVNFPLFSKTEVKGDEIHPLFEFLTTQPNPDFTGDISWNFEKFLIDREGNLIRRFKSKTTPDSEELVGAVIESL
ncbi:MAG: glutathione peroxidase [Balneolaceae bacterium]